MINRLAVIIGMICSLAFIHPAQAGPYYVVIGTFTEESRGRDFAASAMRFFDGVSLKYDEQQKMYHVHVLETSRYLEAETMRSDLEKDGLLNAWVYRDIASGQPSDDGLTAGSEDLVKLELYTGDAVLLSSSDNKYMSISKDREHIRNSASGTAGFAFEFRAETFSGNEVSGTVSIVNRKGAAISTFKTGEAFAFSGSHPLTLICQVPGYTPEIKVITPGELTGRTDISQNKDGVYTVRFHLRRLLPDDVSLTYLSLFHPGTAILREQAKVSLHMLLSWLAADPSRKVVVNTHCNYQSRGAIRIPGKEGDLFDLEHSSIRSGSDKHLTQLRAEVLRDYFSAQGIHPSRVTVMGWRSLSPVVRGTDPRAALNERVEVELVL